MALFNGVTRNPNKSIDCLNVKQKNNMFGSMCDKINDFFLPSVAAMILLLLLLVCKTKKKKKRHTRNGT